jgi:hypothetical protein
VYSIWLHTRLSLTALVTYDMCPDINACAYDTFILNDKFMIKSDVNYFKLARITLVLVVNFYSIDYGMFGKVMDIS